MSGWIYDISNGLLTIISASAGDVMSESFLHYVLVISVVEMKVEKGS